MVTVWGFELELRIYGCRLLSQSVRPDLCAELVMA